MQRPLYKVIKEHKASFPYAMIAKIGDKVIVNKEDSEMPGWYWCRDEDNVEAWVPKTHINIEESFATFNQPYNSIELTVKPGDLVQYLGEALSWTECLNEDWKYGWIPSNKLMKT